MKQIPLNIGFLKFGNVSANTCHSTYNITDDTSFLEETFGLTFDPINKIQLMLMVWMKGMIRGIFKIFGIAPYKIIEVKGD